LFKSIQEEADDLFCKLPPPVHKEVHEYRGGWGGRAQGALPPSFHAAAAPAAPHIDMSIYYNRGAGCIAGECLVAMADGSCKRVRDMVKGDQVISASGRVTHVRCVVKALCEDGANEMVKFKDGLSLTPYHPIQLHGKWEFPQDVAPVGLYPCSAVYNFVLAAEHTMVVNGVVCATLAHGFTEAVVQHPYFGTAKVIEDLQSLREGVSFASGLIVFDSECLQRSRETGLVARYDPTRQL